MGKKERERKLAGKRTQAFGTVKIARPSDEDVNRIFMLKDCVPMTADVIKQMIEIGWAEKKLMECQCEGGMYCPPRDSIMFPEPEGMEMVRDGEDFLIHVHELMVTRPR